MLLWVGHIGIALDSLLRLILVLALLLVSLLGLRYKQKVEMGEQDIQCGNQPTQPSRQGPGPAKLSLVLESTEIRLSEGRCPSLLSEESPVPVLFQIIQSGAPAQGNSNCHLAQNTQTLKTQKWDLKCI